MGNLFFPWNLAPEIVSQFFFKKKLKACASIKLCILTVSRLRNDDKWAVASGNSQSTQNKNQIATPGAVYFSTFTLRVSPLLRKFCDDVGFYPSVTKNKKWWICIVNPLVKYVRKKGKYLHWILYEIFQTVYRFQCLKSL